MPSLRTPASDNTCSVTASVRTLDPSFAKRMVEAIFSTTAPWPDRSDLAAAAAAGVGTGCAVWAVRTGRKQESAAKTINRAVMASLF